jgi:F-type H+-transporting ATPase subunit b
MLDINVTAFIQVINFFIAVVVLNHLLIKPVRNMLKARRDKMDDMLSGARAFNTAAEEQFAGYRDDLARARQEAALMRSSARAEALQEQQALLTEENKRAQEQLALAKQDVVKETESVRAALKTQISPLAARVAERMLV